MANVASIYTDADAPWLTFWHALWLRSQSLLISILSYTYDSLYPGWESNSDFTDTKCAGILPAQPQSFSSDSCCRQNPTSPLTISYYLQNSHQAYMDIRHRTLGLGQQNQHCNNTESPIQNTPIHHERTMVRIQPHFTQRSKNYLR
jgi:hypothetical protein